MNSTKIDLSTHEIRSILRAADEIIGQGGRTLLAKILKGSREKRILALKLDECPAYGHFKGEKLEAVMDKIDWMIDYDLLDIQYSGKLPMIVFTDRGWKIESNQRANEFLDEWNQWLAENKTFPDMTYLKDRNREMIFLFLRKIRETGNSKYIPYLLAWSEIEYKKVQVEIQSTIKALENKETIARQSIIKREESINIALQGQSPEDLLLKCYECGQRFTFSVGEQHYYKHKGFDNPKRCKGCRERRYRDKFYEE